MMYRTILTPTNTTLTIELPEELVGKAVEVLAFEIEKNSREIEISEDPQKVSRKRTFEEAVKFWDENAIDLSKIEKWKREDLYE